MNEIEEKNIVDNLINVLKTFHYSTNLPVWILKDKNMVFKQPENLITSIDILSDKSLLPIIHESEKNIQIINNRLNETCLVLQLPIKNYHISVGPVLTEKIEIGSLTNMVRENIIPFHQKSAMKEYYDSLPVLSEQKLFYVGKLLAHLFNDTKNYINNNEEENIQVDFEEDSYYKQKKEYRDAAFIHSPYTIEQEISKTISNGDTEKAKRILKEINLIPHAKLASSSLRSYKNSMICSCSFMTRAAIAGGVNPDDAFTLSDAYINTIEEFQTIKELESFESKMVEGFTEKVNSIKTSSYSQAILKTMYYIENHLCEDIRIKDIAEIVYLNPSYLSLTFHKETGYTISEWIQRKRIEEASHLVLNSNEDFAEIAFFYRFCSQSYFVQCFKKVFGVTPGEYRKTGKIKNGCLN